ncbi:HEPN-associated N-terminal domain-containing protein [Bacteroides stercorirosoris]|uniref:HEPN-associated N-terminal domain-containing protein n=1 Tax=Bacteroides stercorirosoris TaxID=871324 RepID=UPI003520C074
MGRAKEEFMEMESGYTHPFREDKYVCEDHFDDAYLKQHIARNGQAGTCSYCGKKHVHVLDMRSFMDFVTNKLSERLCPLDYANLPLANSYLDDDNDKIPGFSRAGCYITPDETEQYESTDDLIYHYGLWTSDDRLNSDISSCFACDEWIRNEIFEEDLDTELSREWEGFVDMVKYRKRYTFFQDSRFLRKKEWKDDVLTEIKQMCESILVSVLPQGTLLYRGRPNESGNPITLFEELTSPPVEHAKENRMSAAGISMFYGAFDKNTSITEIRHYCPKATLDMGEFVTTKDLTVVDLFKIPKILSFWMPEYYAEYKFLRQFHDEITKPTTANPGIEYVPTQIFTEYLRYLSSKQIDGIMYKSSLTGDKNVVLFYDNKTSREIMQLNKVFNGL